MADETAPLNADTKPPAATAAQGNLPAQGPAAQAATALKPGDLTPDPNLPKVIKPEPEPDTAKARLRAFEDEHLGKDAVRIKGEIERGVGSPWAAMKPETKRQYEALERVIVTEQKVADAKAALLAAESDHAEAVAATEPKPDAAPVE